MTDIKIILLCAAAMGLRSRVEHNSEVVVVAYRIAKWTEYDTFRNQAQAVDLVTKLHISSVPYQTLHDAWWWKASIDQHNAASQDWNRAICECVAKAQDSKIGSLLEK